MKGLCPYHKIEGAKMTEENYNYRTSPFLLRNQFDGESKFKIPLIPKTKFADEDFKDLLLIGFDRTNLKNNNHLDRIWCISFYMITSLNGCEKIPTTILKS